MTIHTIIRPSQSAEIQLTVKLGKSDIYPPTNDPRSNAALIKTRSVIKHGHDGKTLSTRSFYFAQMTERRYTTYMNKAP